jgi:hypothetical protein
VSTTIGSPVPLWWRNIPADYSLPLFQGRVLLPLRTIEKPLSELGSDHPDLKTFKDAVQEFLALRPDQREVRLLQSLSKKYLFPDRLPRKQKLPANYHTIKKSILGSSSAEEIVNQILTLGREASPDWQYPTSAVLQKAGGVTALRVLEGIAAKQAMSEEQLYHQVIGRIRSRLSQRPIEEEGNKHAENQKAPTEEELKEMRRLLSNSPTLEQFYKVFDAMTQHDPEPIADYLLQWKNPEADWRDVDFGYVIGSYFAWRCGKDRATNFQKLLKAHDPYIRVAGAVYLCFENKNEGMTKLKEVMTLPGDAGVWAALNLARRGDKSAIARALEVFATAGHTNMSGVPHRNLQKRVAVLISNSAHRSHLQATSFPILNDEYKNESERNTAQERIYQYYIAWWNINKDKVTLFDPWLSILERQKVD